jgi:hypothetical protein
VRVEGGDQGFDLARLRSAALSPFAVEVFTKLMQMGGELRIDTEGHLAMKKVNGQWARDEQLRDWRIGELNRLIASDFIEVDPSRSQGFSWLLRLTDEGRALCGRLDEMSAAAKKVDVKMQGDVPVVAGGGTE